MFLRSLWKTPSAPLDIPVTRRAPSPPRIPHFPLPPSAAYDIESRFYDASLGAPSRRRSRCKLLFASLEEIRLRASKATCLPDGGRQRVVERASRDLRGRGSRFYAGIKIWLLGESLVSTTRSHANSSKKTAINPHLDARTKIWKHLELQKFSIFDTSSI